MKKIQCAHPPHHHNGIVATCRLLDCLHDVTLYLYYALCFMLVEHSVCHEPISVLINVFMLRASCLLSTLLVLTLTMHELRHCLSIAGMSPQSHCGDEEDGRIGLSS